MLLTKQKNWESNFRFLNEYLKSIAYFFEHKSKTCFLTEFLTKILEKVNIYT